MSRIAVIGAGVVGVNLARRFAELRHDVVFGARDPGSDKVVAALATVEGSTAAPIQEAVAGADIAVLAVPHGAVDDVLGTVGDPGTTILVDATNSVGAVSSETGPERILRSHPGAVVVKAFNTIGAEAFLDPTAGHHHYFLPISGPEPAASTIRDLAASMGFDALVVGDHDTAELLESHARLWIHLAFRTGLGRDFGFVRVRRGDG